MGDEVLHERELREQWQESHALVHSQEQRAKDLAFTEVNRRLEDMNELRGQIESERGRYLDRDLYNNEHNALRDSIFAKLDMVRDSVDARLKMLESSKSNMEGRMWAVGAGITFLVLIINVAMHYWGK